MATKNTNNKTITLPIEEEKYADFIEKPLVAHETIRSLLSSQPSLFPSSIQEIGYILKGKDRASKKLGIQLRRIKIGNELYRIRPVFALSYMRGYTKAVENALLLIRFGVPFWVIVLIFGRNPMYWYRLFISLSQFSLVGTTVYNKAKMPEHLLADEFHTRTSKKKAYIATVVGSNCLLGANACSRANEADLKEAYGVFKSEVLDLIPDYQPLTVNTDGWSATQNTWKSLFYKVKIIECFLHAVLKIRQRATKKIKANYLLVLDKVWTIYRAETKVEMSRGYYYILPINSYISILFNYKFNELY